MNRDRILIVDDDPDILYIVEQYLLREGFSIAKATNGKMAIQLIDEFRPDMIILDILMPGMDGYETCQIIRQKTDAPILFLSAKEDDIDKILGLRIGGDDYVTKPFSPGELVARVKAHLRRHRIIESKKEDTGHGHIHGHILEFPGLHIDLESCVVKANGKIVSLSAKEFQLLALFAKNAGKVFPVEQLFQLIWGENSFGDFRTVMVHISTLRKKIEPNPSEPKYILTVRGIGYKFNNFIEN